MPRAATTPADTGPCAVCNTTSPLVPWRSNAHQRGPPLPPHESGQKGLFHYLCKDHASTQGGGTCGDVRKIFVPDLDTDVAILRRRIHRAWHGEVQMCQGNEWISAIPTPLVQRSKLAATPGTTLTPSFQLAIAEVLVVTDCIEAAKSGQTTSTRVAGSFPQLVSCQRTARVEATSSMLRSGGKLLGLCTGDFEGFLRVGHPGSSADDWMRAGAGLMVEMRYGSGLMFFDDKMVLLHPGDRLLVPPMARSDVCYYSIDCTIVQAHHVLSYHWISSLAIHVSSRANIEPNVAAASRTDLADLCPLHPIVLNYLSFMAMDSPVNSVHDFQTLLEDFVGSCDTSVGLQAMDHLQRLLDSEEFPSAPNIQPGGGGDATARRGFQSTARAGRGFGFRGEFEARTDRAMSQSRSMTADSGLI